MPSNKKIEKFKGCDNALEHFEICLINEKSQLCPIAPKFFLVGSWVIKDSTGFFGHNS